MIKLSKQPEPDILKDKFSAWTALYVAKISAGEKPSDTEKGRYRHADIKAALIRETHGKCAYCESKITHISYGDVEHIHPKKLDPTNIFRWENLTLACDICNTEKGTEVGVIDPYNDEPSAHLYCDGPAILPVPGSLIGNKTERILKLNRIDLLERRRERRRNLHNAVADVAWLPNSDIKKAALSAIRHAEEGSDREYSATSRDLLKSLFSALALSDEIVN